MNFDEIYSWVKDLPIIDWHNHLDVGAIEHRTKPIVGVQFHPERLAVRDGNTRALKLIKAALEGKSPSGLED